MPAKKPKNTPKNQPKKTTDFLAEFLAVAGELLSAGVAERPKPLFYSVCFFGDRKMSCREVAEPKIPPKIPIVPPIIPRVFLFFFWRCVFCLYSKGITYDGIHRGRATNALPLGTGSFLVLRFLGSSPSSRPVVVAARRVLLSVWLGGEPVSLNLSFRAALKGTDLREQTPICGFLRVPAVFCENPAVDNPAPLIKGVHFHPLM